MTLPILISCVAAPSVVRTHEVIEVPVEVAVPVDERLVQKGELVAPDLVLMGGMTAEEKLIHVTAMYHWNTTRALQCYGNLDEIGALQ